MLENSARSELLISNKNLVIFQFYKGNENLKFGQMRRFHLQISPSVASRESAGGFCGVGDGGSVPSHEKRTPPTTQGKVLLKNTRFRRAPGANFASSAAWLFYS